MDVKAGLALYPGKPLPVTAASTVSSNNLPISHMSMPENGTIISHVETRR